MRKNIQISITSLFFFCLILVCVAPADAATLSLSPSSVSLNVGEQRTLSLSLDPQGDPIIGTDVILTYNPQHLKVVSVVNRNIFPGLPAVKIINEVGTTKFSLINNFGIFQTAQAVVADITLEAITPTTSSPLTLSFSAGNTTDTNVVIEGGQDVLTSVTSAAITIPGPIATPSQAPPTDNPTPTPTPPPTPSVIISPSPTNSTFPPTTVLLDRANPNATGAAALSIVPPGFSSPLPSTQQLTPPARPQILGATNTNKNLMSLLVLSGAAALFLSFITYVLFRRRKPPSQSKNAPNNFTQAPFVHTIAY